MNRLRKENTDILFPLEFPVNYELNKRYIRRDNNGKKKVTKYLYAHNF